MKTATLTLLLFLAPTAFSRATEAWDAGSDRLNLPHKYLTERPDKVLRLDRQKRMPASVDDARARRQARLQELDQKLKLGTHAMIRGSVPEWNDKVAKIVARYEDGSRQIELPSGKRARVKFENLITLSPETTQCCESHSVKVCKGDKVYHPLPSSSLGVPEGRVEQLFENCNAVVRDGLDFVYDASQLGKVTDCSPQKMSVCVGKMVYVEGHRNGERYEFEGPVARVYTNGTVLVRTGLWLMPIDYSAVKVQTESLDPGIKSTAVITSRDGQGKLPTPTMQELEPALPDLKEEADQRHGTSAPSARSAD